MTIEDDFTKVKASEITLLSHTSCEEFSPHGFEGCLVEYKKKLEQKHGPSEVKPEVRDGTGLHVLDRLRVLINPQMLEEKGSEIWTLI